MKKRLTISLAVTIAMMLLLKVSDATLGTKYMGETEFQPFPHLVLFGGIISSLYFWYKLREEKARVHVPPKGKTLLDRFILYICFLLVVTLLCMTAQYFGLLPSPAVS